MEKKTNLETILTKHEVNNVFKSLELRPLYEALERLIQKEKQEQPEPSKPRGFIAKLGYALWDINKNNSASSKPKQN